MPDLIATPGDYTGDGLIDAADYDRWRLDFGTTVAVAGTGADGNGDGLVNAADFVVWRNLMNSGSGSAFVESAVPEPPTLICFLFASASLAASRRRTWPSRDAALA
jgi:hypothetical protein